MNMFKKNGGFTLVELIVVIAILAILAAVAVPAYTGYIEKAEESAWLQTLSTVNTAVQGLAIAEGASVTSIEVTAAGDVTGYANDGTNDITITNDAVVGLTGPLNFGTGFPGAEWALDAGVGKWTIN